MASSEFQNLKESKTLLKKRAGSHLGQNDNWAKEIWAKDIWAGMDIWAIDILAIDILAH